MSVKSKKRPRARLKASAEAAGAPMTGPGLPHDVTPAVFYPRQGALIAAARQKEGLTQAQLATHIGHKRASISHIEAGIQKPLPHILLLIADVLKVEINDLFPHSLAETRSMRARLDALPAEERVQFERHMPGFQSAP
jgi:transcriptional regulator with XRE-family HTH domain